MSFRAERRTDLDAALHRLRSTLARVKAEVELAEDSGGAPPAERLLGDLSQALRLLESVEAAVYSLVPVLVIDDDERLGELTARGLRRLGYDADSRRDLRPLRDREVVVLDLSVSSGLADGERAILKSARPIVVTGAADPSSRALATSLDASAYLLKPVDLEELAAAIKAHHDER